MRAQDERGLEEQLVHDATAAAVEIEALAVRALGVLVGQAEAQERLGLALDDEWDVPTFLRKQVD